MNRCIHVCIYVLSVDMLLMVQYIVSSFVSEIMSLSNTLIYNNRLECGNDNVASGTLHLPNPSHLHTLTAHSNKKWLNTVIDPQIPVLFVNTDKCLGAIESSTGDQMCNGFEAAIVKEVILNLIEVSARILHQGEVKSFEGSVRVFVWWYFSVHSAPCSVASQLRTLV